MGNGNGNGNGNIKEINIDFNIFWDLYDKKRGDKSKLEKKWNELSQINLNKPNTLSIDVIHQGTKKINYFRSDGRFLVSISRVWTRS